MMHPDVNLMVRQEQYHDLHRAAAQHNFATAQQPRRQLSIWTQQLITRMTKAKNKRIVTISAPKAQWRERQA